MIARFGKPPLSGQKYTLRAGSYMIAHRDDKIMLTHYTGSNPEIQLPGGGIDPGENMIAALHRECIEETGWRISIQRRLGAFRRFTFLPEYDMWAEKICHVFLARPVLQLCAPTEPDHSVLWADLSEAPELVGNPGDRAFLQDFRHFVETS